MILMTLASGIIGGIEAAGRDCELRAEAEKLEKALQEYVQTMSNVFDTYKSWSVEIQNQILEVNMKINQAIVALKDRRIKYAIFMKKLQLFVSMIIIIVFMLLVGKKLKVY